MKKGLEYLKRIEYEMNKNSEQFSQSVKVPKRDLEKLLQLAQENQYRLDLQTVKEISDLLSQVKHLETQNRKLQKLTKQLTQDETKEERDVL